MDSEPNKTCSIKKIHTLAKISRRPEQLEALRKGLLFMNPLTYFQKLEKRTHKGIADSFEGASSVFQADKMIVSVGIDRGEQRYIKCIDQLVFHTVFDHTPYVFCFYGLHTDPWESLSSENAKEILKHLQIPDRVRTEFGDGILYFHNPHEFIRRLVAKLEQGNLPWRLGPVEYYDPKVFHGEIERERIGFLKPNSFQYQNEFRLVVLSDNQNGEPLRLEVGDLSDLCCMCNIDSFNRTAFRLDPPDVKLWRPNPRAGDITAPSL